MKHLDEKLHILLEEVSSLRSMMREHFEAKELEGFKFMNLDKLIKYLYDKKGAKFSKSSIYKLTSTAEIPTHKAGNKLVFVTEEIDAWFETRLNNKTKKTINNNVPIIMGAIKKLK